MRNFLFLTAWILITSHVAIADELRLDAKELYSRSITHNLHLNGSSIELERGILVEDDGPAAGYSYQPNLERLTPDVRIRKELVIADPRANQVHLLIGSGGKLQATINGPDTPLTPDGKAGAYWQSYLIPSKSLKAGKNTIVLSGTGQVWIARDEDFAAGSRERSHHPNRSARSTDGGRTWDDAHLGVNGDVDGEYYVRLFLDQYQPQGTMLLPVIDTGNLQGEVISPHVTPGDIHIRANGSETQLTIEARTGPTPIVGKDWSDWKEIKGTLQQPSGRYLQIKLTLSTSNPLESPKLMGLVIETSPQVKSHWTTALKVLDSHNPRIVRTSIPFEYEPYNHPALKQLRKQHNLDVLVKGAKSEFELITRLAAWSSQLWKRGHLRDEYPSWNALDILKPHTDGTPVGGFCQQYNLVFLQACESFGIPGRAVSLGPGRLVDKPRRGGHEVVELWSNEHAKWIFIDGDHARYAVDQETGVPLSLWELRQRQLSTLANKTTPATRIVEIAETPRGGDWTDLAHGVPFGELRMIPRSNFLDRVSPKPLNQGMRGWFWTGHYVWSDPELPAEYLYGHRVVNRHNWEWTLNQAHFTLEATDTPGVLQVHLDTETPGFDTFLADVDEQGTRPVQSGFRWKLHEGENTLEVRSRNIAGREGPISRVVLRYQPLN